MNINEAVLSFTKDIRYISKICTKNLEQFHSSNSAQTISAEDYGSITIEFENLFIHIIDRYTHMLCPEDLRKVFIDTLGFSVINARIDEGFSNNPDEKLINEVWEYEIALLNTRNVEYANFKKLYPDKGEEKKDTLFWEFGKRITFDYLHSSNPAEVLYCSIIGSDIITKVKIEKILNEISFFPSNSEN